MVASVGVVEVDAIEITLRLEIPNCAKECRVTPRVRSRRFDDPVHPNRFGSSQRERCGCERVSNVRRNEVLWHNLPVNVALHQAFGNASAHSAADAASAFGLQDSRKL